MNITESLKVIKKETERIVKDIYKNRNNDNYYHKGIFNTIDLPEHQDYKHSPNIDSHFENIIFRKLNKITSNHCLYWFELESNEKAYELKLLMNEYGKTEGCKKIPATNKNSNSKVLYLGVRQGGVRGDGLTNIEGRMNQHLGYYHKPSTQGLQLYEYAKGKNFEITLKVIEFQGIETYYLNVIEKLLAKEMKPLSGRH